MDLLRRSLAPITEEAWNVIDDQARNVLKGCLSARKAVDVKGPFGWDYHGWPMGRIEIAEAPFVDGASYGIRRIQPLVEVRVPFSMSRWDLDDISRGSETTDMAPLEEAARKVALFEEKAIYTGMDSGCILGMENAADNGAVKISSDDDGAIQAVAEAVMSLKSRSVDGPYALIAQKELWKRIVTVSKGYPLRKRIESIVDDVILSPVVDRSFVISRRGKDMNLVLGQDLSIGYAGSSDGMVELFFTESFTFFVPGPEAIVPLTL